jgi:hypothetical protein
MSSSTIPDLKRIEFFNGQRLTAQDLTDLQDANAQLRWLHNRSLHGWGIGIGYAVTGEAGDTTITIAPGYAIDCLGRELILTQPVTIPVPAVAGVSAGGAQLSSATFFLTITYLDDALQPTVESRPGVCLPSGTVRLAEGPLVQWQQLKDIQDGLNVILAEASVLNCQLNAPLGLDVRRNARPAEQPYINAGQVAPAAITWTPIVGGIIVRVDTSAAKFASIPAYFTHVMGPRQVQVPQPLASGGVTQYSLVTVPLIELPAPDGFVLQVLMLQFDKSNAVVAVPPADVLNIIPVLNWTIVWMGIEG